MDYKKLSIGLALVVAFLAGCVVHDVVRVAPPARASAVGQRWEYECRESRRGITKMANDQAAQGWELVTAVGAAWSDAVGADYTMVWCFKRPLP
jgi:opacity protein-like surface antigen